MLVLFAGAMLLLTAADNVFVLFLAWELTSITSYLLIGFKDQEVASRAAALQALLVTGMGGLALLGGFVVLGQAADTYTLSGFSRQHRPAAPSASPWPVPDEPSPVTEEHGVERLGVSALMIGSTGVLVVASLLVAVAASPIYEVSERAARILLDRDVYIEAVLGR